MSQLLDSSSAGNPPPPTTHPRTPTPTQPPTRDLSAPISPLRCQARLHTLRASWEPGFLLPVCGLSPEHRHPPPLHHFLLLPLSTSFILPEMSRHVPPCGSLTPHCLSAASLSSIPGFSSCLFRLIPRCSIILTLRQHRETLTVLILQEKRCSITSLKLKSSPRQSRNRLRFFFVFFLVEENRERMSRFKRDDREPVCRTVRHL